MSAKYDLFPAFVTLAAPDETTPLSEVSSGPARPTTARSYDKARVVIMSNRVIIAVDSDKGPRTILDERYITNTLELSSDRTQDSRVQTLLGFKLAFKKNEACGCGSRLRSWNPYRILNSTHDPTE
jgi:hypothetical protein